jgi:hypothetical protein
MEKFENLSLHIQSTDTQRKVKESASNAVETKVEK